MTAADPDADATWRMERLPDPDALLPLSNALDEIVLRRPVPSPFETVGFLHPVAKRIAAGFDYRAVYRANRLVALLPLVRHPHPRAGQLLPRFEFPETEPRMPCDWILNPQERGLAEWILATLWRERTWADCLFHTVPAGSPLLQLAPAHPTSVVSVLLSRPYVAALGPTWEDHLQTYSSKRRNYIRRVCRMRKLAEMGTPRIRRYPQEETDLAVLLEDMRVVASETWKADTLDVGAYVDLNAAVLRSMADRNRVVAFTLRVDERPVAYFFCLTLAQRLFPLLTGFHPDVAAGSPGAVLIAEALQYGCAHGYSELHFGTDWPYVSHWAQSQSEFYRVRIFSTTVRGRILRSLSAHRSRDAPPTPEPSAGSTDTK